MLVLSRKKGEKIAIAGTEIVLTIVEIRGDKVRLGFEAAKDIAIHRMEVYERSLTEASALKKVDESELLNLSDVSH